MAAASPVTTTASSRRFAATLPVFTATIFLSAALLFGIQPMFAKMVLPRLGGSPGVWSVAMVFFQAMLLAGYAYAHWLVARFTLRRAALLHLGLMAVVIALALPIGIAAGFERPPADGEFAWLVALFGLSVGLPFFAVAANGPLLQAWFARSGHPHAEDPYFLYAASNAGSFLSLLAYPLLIEPTLRLSTQAAAWSWGFALLLAGVAACAGLAIGRGDGDEVAPETTSLAAAPIAAATKLGWVALAFVPSGLLVAVTAHISTDVAAAPFLWVVPLALFLLTFVFVFQRRPWLSHGLMLKVQLGLFAVLLLTIVLRPAWGWGFALLLHLSLFFATAMVAHGELARRRPDAGNLTAFYLWMSFGGVLGGLFSGLLAPLLFNSVVEYPVLIIAGMLCRPGLVSRLSPLLRTALALTALAGLAGIVAGEWRRNDTIRSFFGVHKIMDTADGQYRLLVHGTTIHGAQRLKDADGNPVTGRPEPLSYYFTGGGLADAIDLVRQARGGRLETVAAVGVGTGSLACQAREGERWDFYEIDPVVVRLATDPQRFRFVSSCKPEARFVLGDARITLADTADGSLDLLVIDAFSSDAIPVHLLTREALALYARKLKPDGAAVVHISNRNMELGPVLAATAAAEGLATWIRDPVWDAKAAKEHRIDPHVALLARGEADVPTLARNPRWKRQGNATIEPWTDDYADILGAIRRKLWP